MFGKKVKQELNQEYGEFRTGQLTIHIQRI